MAKSKKPKAATSAAPSTTVDPGFAPPGPAELPTARPTGFTEAAAQEIASTPQDLPFTAAIVGPVLTVTCSACGWEGSRQHSATAQPEAMVRVASEVYATHACPRA